MATDERDSVIYLRQSQDRTGEELAITRQREDGERLAKFRKARVLEVISENDTSASGRVTRPGFDRVLELIEAGKVGTVISWDLTRLTRNFADTLRLLTVGQKAGVVLAFVKGTDLDLGTADGRMTAGILSSIAGGEIAKKSERQKRAAEQAAAEGRPYGGRRPFGYEADKTTVRPDEAAAFRGAYESVLAGVPLARAAAELNAAGFTTTQVSRKTKEPSPWTGQSLGAALKAPRYAGLRAVTVRGEKGRPTWKIIGPAAWDGIVPEETWRATVSLLEAPGRRRPGATPRGLLTGIALCGVCGATVHRGGAARSTTYPTYRCSGSMGHLARRADHVEDYVRDVVIARLSREDAAELLVDDDRPDADALRTEASAIRTSIDELATLLGEKVLTAAGVRRESARLNERLAEVEALQADAGRVDVLGPLIGADDVRAVWDGLGADRQRAVIDVLMNVVLMPPGRGTRAFRHETVRLIPR